MNKPKAKLCEQEMLRMLYYAKEKGILLTENDILKVKSDMHFGMSLENDEKNEKFFVDMHIMSPKMTQSILQKGIEHATKDFQNKINSSA